jgi:hypothetical protein
MTLRAPLCRVDPLGGSLQLHATHLCSGDIDDVVRSYSEVLEPLLTIRSDLYSEGVPDLDEQYLQRAAQMVLAGALSSAELRSNHAPELRDRFGHMLLKGKRRIGGTTLGS